VRGAIVWALKGDDTHGILIGSGTKAVDYNDYRLDSKIPNGVGSGKMLYLTCTIEPTYVSGNLAFFRISRSFLNASGGDIYVRELGVAAHQADPYTDVLLIRDLMPETKVQDGYTFNASYTIIVEV